MRHLKTRLTTGTNCVGPISTEGTRTTWLEDVDCPACLHQLEWDKRTVDDSVEGLKREILDDVARGRVPRHVASFGELHDYLDANTYGGFCGEPFFRKFEGAAPDELGQPLGFNHFVREVQDRIDLWIKKGGVLRAPAKKLRPKSIAERVAAAMRALEYEDAVKVCAALADAKAVLAERRVTRWSFKDGTTIVTADEEREWDLGESGATDYCTVSEGHDGDRHDCDLHHCEQGCDGWGGDVLAHGVCTVPAEGPTPIKRCGECGGTVCCCATQGPARISINVSRDFVPGTERLGDFLMRKAKALFDLAAAAYRLSGPREGSLTVARCAKASSRSKNGIVARR